MLKNLLRRQSKKFLTNIYFQNSDEAYKNHNFDQNIKIVNKPKPKGTLTIIPTPIGNLRDVTPNMLKKLYEADLIGCEDRRVAGQLFKLIKQRKIIHEVVDAFGDIGVRIPKVDLDINKKSMQNSSSFGDNALIESNLSKFGESNFDYENSQEKYFGENYFLTQNQQEKQYIMEKFHQMSDKDQKRFARRSFKTVQLQKQFMLEYLKYKSVRLMNRHQQFLYKQKMFKKGSKNSHQNEFDDLYGLQSSDFGSIDLQIQRARVKKGRGLLIPLNTYNQTKMYDLVRMLLESRKVAIVTDAGMPCISDPGWKMVDHIRNKMPDAKIQVVGGPSSVSVMLFLANIAPSKSPQLANNLSGRFQGFAAPEVSQVTDEHAMYDEREIKIKKQDFSIHFINARKLKKHAAGLQKIYGENHRIIIASQLTKLFERKFHGTLKELNDFLLKDSNIFQNGGEMSYILYPSTAVTKFQIKRQENIKQYRQQDILDLQQKYPVITINIDYFIEALALKDENGADKIHEKQKTQILKSVFNMKTNQAKKKVYQKLKPVKHNYEDLKKAYENFPEKQKLKNVI